MSARDEVLRRVRSALKDGPREATGEGEAVAWEYGRATAMDDVLSHFLERVEDYRAAVVRVPADQVARTIAEALTSRDIPSAVLPAGVPGAWAEAVSAAGVRVERDDPPLDHQALDAVGAVVTAAAVGIAETGTVVLDHGADQGRRALSLVPDVHVCVVRADQVVSDVPEAVARLRQAVVGERRPLTWISGPSATSDIELDRVEGVHGPRTLIVVLAE